VSGSHSALVGGAAIQHTFPVDGEYRIKIRLQKTMYGAVRGLAEAHDLEVRFDRQRVAQFTVGGADVAPPPSSFAGTLTWNPEWERYSHQADNGLDVTIAARSGTHTLGGRVREAVLGAGRCGPANPERMGVRDRRNVDGNPAVETVTIEGPLAVQGSGDTESRRRIFICQPKAGGDEPCARRILATLARRAYRRAVSEDDLRRCSGSSVPAAVSGTFDAGIEAGAGAEC